MANGKPEEPIPSSCLLGHDNQRRISTLERDQNEQKADMNKAITEIKADQKSAETGIWSELGKLRDQLDRLPAWATLAMTGLGAISGAAVSIVISRAFG